MNQGEIDRALGNDQRITPTPEFAARVMGVVRREAREREALGFPWRRLLPGLTACAILTLAGLLLGTPAPASQLAPAWMLDPAMAQAMVWVPMTLLCSWVLVWGSMRLAGHRR